MGLEANLVTVFTTSRCTLNCRYCGAFVPEFKENGKLYDANAERTRDAVSGLFAIYDHIGHLDFTGGEALLWNGLADTLTHAASFARQGKIDFLRILTNGTLLPSEKLLGVINRLDCKLDFFIDNYGDLSHSVVKLKEVLDANGITWKETSYTGQSQDYGGWIDFGDLTLKNRADEENTKTFMSCLQAQHICRTVFDDTLYNCGVAPVAINLGKVPKGAAGGIPLLGHKLSVHEKRVMAENFGKMPLAACAWCNGFDNINAPRFPAAEQL